MSELESRLMEDYKTALRAGDEIRKETLRLMRSAIQSAAIDKRAPLSDEEIWAVLTKQVNQRLESIEMFKKGGRSDLVEREEAELTIIREYLPEQLSRQEIEALARQVIEEVGATGPRDMGKVMGTLIAQVRGRADGRLVNEVVRSLLQGG